MDEPQAAVEGEWREVHEEEVIATTTATAATAAEAEAAVPDADEYSLAREFYDAYKSYSTFIRTEAKSPEQQDLDDLSSKLKAIAFYVRRLRLFSPNEELDDISTCDLKFLILPYLLAEVAGATRDMDKRLGLVKQAIVFWRAFAHDCERLKVADDEDLKAIDRDPEARLDPMTKRDEKIARYKRSKELDEKIEYLFSKKKESIGDELKWGSGGQFDEDMERDLILALIRRGVSGTVENITCALQELPMLEMMMARGGPGKGPVEKPPQKEKPFIMQIKNKDELMQIYADMVFQCPHPLPTMTLAECADIEMADAQDRQQREQNAQMRQQLEQDRRWFGGDRNGSQEVEEDGQKTYKDREWDDWKDEHPWGSGNKMANVG